MQKIAANMRGTPAPARPLRTYARRRSKQGRTEVRRSSEHSAHPRTAKPAPLLATRRDVLLGTAASIGSAKAAPIAEQTDGGALSLLHPAGYYLAAPGGNAVYLTGSHTWTDGQDVVPGTAINPTTVWDYASYLSFLASKRMNFIRLWKWDGYYYGVGSRGWKVSPLAYVQTAPGKFDLAQFNQAYFDRILQRVTGAATRGIYVSVMCFAGYTATRNDQEWTGSPFNINNNVNGVNGDPNKTDTGRDLCKRTSGPLWNCQTAFLRKLIATLRLAPNVLFEVTNEPEDDDAVWAWLNAVVDYIHATEASGGGLRHPVGITPPYPPAKSCAEVNAKLLASHADWVSFLGSDGTYFTGVQPVAPGTKPVLLDTDHIYGGGGNWQWVYTSFMRGYNPIFMDDFEPCHGDTGHLVTGTWSADIGADKVCNRASARDAMGCTRKAASMVRLETMRPAPTMCSTGWALVDPTGGQYIGYTENPARPFRMDLSGSPGQRMNVRWAVLRKPDFDVISGGTVVGGSSAQSFLSPVRNSAMFLILTPAS